MSNKNYRIIKTTPCTVLFELHPVSNMGLTRRIILNNKVTQVALPEDWALGIFQDDAVFDLYRKGAFTFDDNEGLVKAAFEAGVYYDESLDFKPKTEDRDKKTLAILNSGNRNAIVKLITEEGTNYMKDLATLHAPEFTTNVIALLENLLKIQLIPDGNIGVEEE